MRTQHNQDGVTLLITLLLMGVLMGVSASLLSVTLKQYQLSSISLASEIAFEAANAGVECVLYNDFPKTGASPFDVNGNGTTVPEETNISCMNGVVSSDIEPSNNNTVVSGEEQRFQFDWGTSPNQACTNVSIYKFYSTTGAVDILINGVDMRPSSDCPMGGVCTVIQSRGYNVSCGEITSGAKVVEREFSQIY
ncbi:MAG: hypothetical protein WAW13_03830 [Minisyncoccia bacterium]